MLRLRQLVPAITDKAKLSKIKRIRQLNNELQVYVSQSRDKALSDLKSRTVRVSHTLKDGLDLYISNELLSISLDKIEPVSEFHEHAKQLILGRIQGDDFPIFQIEVLSQPVSPARSNQWVDFRCWRLFTGAKEDCSDKKLLKLCKKAIYKSAKENDESLQKLLDIS